MKLKAHEVLAVGIDPAKDKHSIVALRYPDEVLFTSDIPNSPEAIRKMDVQMLALSKKEGLSLIYATESSLVNWRMKLRRFFPLKLYN